MRRWAWAVVLAVVWAALAATLAARAEEPAFDVCETQIREYLAREFDQTVKRIEFRFRTNVSPMSFFNLSQAIVFPNECPGFHFFELHANDFTCQTQAHYGKAPNYLIYRSSGDGC